MCLFLFPVAAVDIQQLGFHVITFSIRVPSIGCVDFNITDDSEFEGEHDFTIEITNISSMAPHAVIGSPNKTIVTIVDSK